ncbi:MAG TPA: hypothetical protein VFT74_18845 [Isosphaeraceae bacterium]|nr:hypothetical protein [Isosphaeraceae bacterium]
MKRQRMDVTCALIQTELPGIWACWCPELDVVSQGFGPENAIGMLADAIHLMVTTNIESSYWDEHLGEVRTRVTHPRRLGEHAKDDDHWKDFREYNSRTGRWAYLADLDPRRLDDGKDPIAFVPGSMEWRLRGGIPQVYVDFYDYCYVPAQVYLGTISQPKIVERRLVARASDPKTPEEAQEMFEVLLDEHEKVLSVKEIKP